ncbi:hypothetical protein [Amycolatopsis suaedae]|uniref:Uncharacterized protein n=1 Tax=Amycolatopsis suaedae TaxID=2510978 RepID=A0A4Q7JDA6_9PSEU|nr:hypothetical protein [Amycolatopsis suaedae]RZQ65052.1 hypothetical protein EWH70_03875 [Amycolatopsis suaedae]
MSTPFPGRWAGGVSATLAPVLLLAGMLLRYGPHFFFPHQLAAFGDQPNRMLAAYSLVLLGTVLLWPGVAALVASCRRRGWALCGGVLVILGLFGRTFSAGVDHLAASLVPVLGAQGATELVAQTYGAFHMARLFTVATLFGWVVLAVAVWPTSRVRAIALGLGTCIPVGVLKGTDVFSLVGAAGLAVALVPFGLSLLFAQPRPRPLVAARWTAVAVLATAGMFVLGQFG